MPTKMGEALLDQLMTSSLNAFGLNIVGVSLCPCPAFEAEDPSNTNDEDSTYTQLCSPLLVSSSRSLPLQHRFQQSVRQLIFDVELDNNAVGLSGRIMV
jgi:hypothetical protein